MRPVVYTFMVAALLCSPAIAERTLLADDYADKLAGMWLGEILGNYAGRPTEGRFKIPGGNPAAEISWDFVATGDDGLPRTRWDGDDDTVLEWMYAASLTTTPAPTHADVRQTWETYVPMPSFYIANKQARWLMASPTPDRTPPQTGSIKYNMHWYAIDSQITTEAVGALTPGMRQHAADLSGRFARATNDGYAVHAAQFYAALYAAGAMETAADAATIESLIAKGLEVVPTTSRTHEVIADVVAWYNADKAAHAADPSDPMNWRDTHALVYAKYVGDDAHGRYRGWIESTVNTAMTTLSLLYGGGDFKETVAVGVLAGFDNDCNPATAAGLIGLINGASGLPADLTAATVDAYRINSLNVAERDTTITDIATMLQTAAEAQILAAGGSISGSGATRTYHLPDADTVVCGPERPDPTGAGGLVGLIQQAGGDVTPSASRHWVGASDRRNLLGIIDGVIDVTYNGHLPYQTYDYTTVGEAEDWYALDFDRDVTLTKVIFHEGDITWETINGNPADPDGIRGGYFDDLTVEVGVDGVFTEVTGLQFSEALDPLVFFQQIELTFDPAVADAVRIRGAAGGSRRFTSIAELEAFGLIGAPTAGDANADGCVDIDDLIALAAGYGTGAGAPWHRGDFSGDGAVDLIDLGLLADNYGYGVDTPLDFQADLQATGIPEPATGAMMMMIGAMWATGRKRGS